MIEVNVNVHTQDAFRAMQAQAAAAIAAERETLEDLRAGIRGDLDKVTATWEHKPTFFEQKTRAAAGNLFAGEIRITTNDRIFTFVDKGTRPHIIPVGEKGFLAFRAGYARKTTPGYISSTPGGAFGPWVFTRKAIRHPGTKPRRFSETIMRKWQQKAGPLLERRIQMALHGMFRSDGWR